MTNWPNIQEYRNFEAKFIDGSKRNGSTDSAADSDLETVIEDNYKNEKNAGDFLNNQKPLNSESKIVRCVMRKDFEETFKKVGREDGMVFNQESLRPKPQEPTVDRSLDKVRLENHLKWKKQKEEEYLQKKEAEKIAQRKKKEEELRLEKAKKQKEKERDEKIREWQEQKAREKEEKKKEKMVIKKLEEELKVTPSVNKDKLIEEWVKLKNKQKQIETEKQAELLRKKEESKAIRQTLAELSYRQWKERVKGRMMTLPKNGYQIFGPKPVPVVKEDWNHDFIANSPRDQNCSLRNFRSSTSTNFTFRPGIKEMDLSKDIFYEGELKNKNPSFYCLKTPKSKLSLFENSETNCKAQSEMPLKELQPGTIDLKKKETKNWGNDFDKRKTDFNQNELRKKSEMSFCTNRSRKYKFSEDFFTDIMNSSTAPGDQNQCSVSSQVKKHSELLNTLPGAQILPNKNKIELYLNHCPDEEDNYNNDEDSQEVIQKKQKIKGSNVKINKEGKKEIAKKKSLNKVIKNTSKEKCCSQNRARSLSLQKFEKNTNGTLKSSNNPNNKKHKALELESANIKVCRSQSCDKSIKKISKSELKIKGCLTSKSMIKVTETTDEPNKSLRLAKGKTCNQKRKSRKPDSFEVTASKSEKKLLEVDHKIKKKLKRKNLSKSYSFSDSPYCAKNFSINLNKVKAAHRKNTKDVETKSDECASKAISD